MITTNAQHVERALEEIRHMPLPENEDIFSLEINEEEGFWQIHGVVGPFARRIQDGEPYPVMCMLPLHELEFSSRKEALDFVQKVHDVLIERGKTPEGTTTRLLDLDS